MVHGCIDGYSRLITNLDVTTDNTAATAFYCFAEGLYEYGIPGHIRMDGGAEFNHVESFMAGRCIRGKSVHNQRIERLWRDVYEKVLDSYYTVFHVMEAHGILNIENDIHLWALHFVFKPRIANHLEDWRKAHNEHRVRTERSQSPIQLWFSGCIKNKFRDCSAMKSLFRYTVDDRRAQVNAFMTSNALAEPRNIGVVLSRIPTPLTNHQLHMLSSNIDVLADSSDNGINIYGQVVRSVRNYIAA